MDGAADTAARPIIPLDETRFPVDDLATLNGKPRPLAIGGEVYDIYPLALADFGDLQTWVNAQFPDPVTAIKPHLADFNVTQQQYMMRTAIELATKPKPKIGTPEADALLQSVDGIKEILFVSIRKGDPAFTRQDAAKIYRAVGVEDIGRLFRDTNVDLVISDPKADGPDGTSGGSTTTP